MVGPAASFRAAVILAAAALAAASSTGDKCIPCGEGVCLLSFCREGSCHASQVALALTSAGWHVDIPEPCVEDMTYTCKHDDDDRSMVCEPNYPVHIDEHGVDCAGAPCAEPEHGSIRLQPTELAPIMTDHMGQVPEGPPSGLLMVYGATHEDKWTFTCTDSLRAAQGFADVACRQVGHARATEIKMEPLAPIVKRLGTAVHDAGVTDAKGLQAGVGAFSVALKTLYGHETGLSGDFWRARVCHNAVEAHNVLNCTGEPLAKKCSITEALRVTCSAEKFDIPAGPDGVDPPPPTRSCGSNGVSPLPACKPKETGADSPAGLPVMCPPLFLPQPQHIAGALYCAHYPMHRSLASAGETELGDAEAKPQSPDCLRAAEAGDMDGIARFCSSPPASQKGSDAAGGEAEAAEETLVSPDPLDGVPLPPVVCYLGPEQEPGAGVPDPKKKGGNSKKETPPPKTNVLELTGAPTNVGNATACDKFYTQAHCPSNSWAALLLPSGSYFCAAVAPPPPPPPPGADLAVLEWAGEGPDAEAPLVFCHQSGPNRLNIPTCTPRAEPSMDARLTNRVGLHLDPRPAAALPEEEDGVSFAGALQSRMAPSGGAELGPQLCRAGVFCPNLFNRTACPAGSYCWAGAVHPVGCEPDLFGGMLSAKPLEACPPGSTEAPNRWDFIILLGALAAVGLVITSIYDGVRSSRAAAANAFDQADGQGSAMSFYLQLAHLYEMSDRVLVRNGDEGKEAGSTPTRPGSLTAGTMSSPPPLHIGAVRKSMTRSTKFLGKAGTLFGLRDEMVAITEDKPVMTAAMAAAVEKAAKRRAKGLPEVDDSGSGSFAKLPDRISFQFENLGMRVRASAAVIARRRLAARRGSSMPEDEDPAYQTVLKSVSGTIDHSTLTAVMGVSGCGKSTFMNVLCGRAQYGEPTGMLYVNGLPADLEGCRSRMGFVPQEDTVREALTVYENIAFSARLRLPRCTAPARVRHVVADVIDMLGLQSCRDTVVGSATVRGISGGQRKRVNIGLELAADPIALFLDEPTSGLDASTSELVFQALRSLSRRGRTVVMVLHQPRYSTFKLLDRLILLGVGGRTLFCGEPLKVVPYLASVGYQMRYGENPADFMLDVVSGLVPRDTRPKRVGEGADQQPSMRPSASSTNLHSAARGGKGSAESTDFLAEAWERLGPSIGALPNEEAPVVPLFTQEQQTAVMRIFRATLAAALPTASAPRGAVGGGGMDGIAEDKRSTGADKWDKMRRLSNLGKVSAAPTAGAGSAMSPSGRDFSRKQSRIWGADAMRAVVEAAQEVTQRAADEQDVGTSSFPTTSREHTRSWYFASLDDQLADRLPSLVGDDILPAADWAAFVQGLEDLCTASVLTRAQLVLITNRLSSLLTCAGCVRKEPQPQRAVSNLSSSMRRSPSMNTAMNNAPATADEMDVHTAVQCLQIGISAAEMHALLSMTDDATMSAFDLDNDGKITEDEFFTYQREVFGLDEAEIRERWSQLHNGAPAAEPDVESQGSRGTGGPGVLSHRRNTLSIHANMVAHQRRVDQRVMPTFWSELKYLTSSYVAQQRRLAGGSAALGEWGALAIVGCFVGALQRSQVPDGYGKLPTIYALVLTLFSLFVALPAVRTFGFDATSYWRESSTGINSLAFYWSRALADLPTLCLRSYVFGLCFWSCGAMNATLSTIVVLMHAVMLCATGFAYVIAIVMPSSLAVTVCGVLLTCVCGFFAGIVPTLREAAPHMRAVLNLSYGRWSTQCIASTDLMNIPNPLYADVGSQLIRIFGWPEEAELDEDGLGPCTVPLRILFVTGVLLRLAGCAALIYCHRDKQHKPGLCSLSSSSASTPRLQSRQPTLMEMAASRAAFGVRRLTFDQFPAVDTVRDTVSAVGESISENLDKTLTSVRESVRRANSESRFVRFGSSQEGMVGTRLQGGANMPAEAGAPPPASLY